MTDVTNYLDGRTLILLSNREPYEHLASAEGIHVRQPPGGLVSALDPRCDAPVAFGSRGAPGSADRETADNVGRLGVPPFEPAYTLRRVWLNDDDIDGYYLGFANTRAMAALSPADPTLRVSPRALGVLSADQRAIRAPRCTRSRFARRTTPQVWVQDYHFALVAAEICVVSHRTSSSIISGTFRFRRRIC